MSTKSFHGLSDAELLHRAWAHDRRGLDDCETYWRALEDRFPDLSREEIWQWVAPRGAMWTGRAEERYGNLGGDQYPKQETQTSLALDTP